MENYKILPIDQAFLREMETDILLQAFAGIVRSEKYVDLYPILDEIHHNLIFMETW